jgi:hypothetical protein
VSAAQGGPCWVSDLPQGTWEHAVVGEEHRVVLRFPRDLRAGGFGPTKADALESAFRNLKDEVARNGT